MNGKKIGQISAILYIIAYIAAMLAPKKNQNHFQSSNSLMKILHEILYYSGPLEPVANFFFLIPIFLFLVFNFGRANAPMSLLICIALAATSEMLQIFIPGRVSSLQDFLLNSLGAVSAYLFEKIDLKKRLRH